jgi:hypothetical protein
MQISAFGDNRFHVLKYPAHLSCSGTRAMVG